MKTIIATALILTSTSVYAQDQTALNTQAIQDLVSYSQANRSGGAGNYEAINANANTIASNASAIEVIAERPAAQDGRNGLKGDKGDTGKAAVSPLGSLSFAAAGESFSGSGAGFGLSSSSYSGLEGSVVLGFALNNDWRVVAGITTDFKGKTAGTVGVGVSF
tara:strand:- start:455 stop:943 length:489 start_codon:yes stop_codon:yes gene_type:complete